MQYIGPVPSAKVRDRSKTLVRTLTHYTTARMKEIETFRSLDAEISGHKDKKIVVEEVDAFESGIAL